MAAIIRLEDGRGLYGSTVSIDGMLSLIARHISDEHAELRSWLADKANRPAPFLGLDVGGLDSANRAEFYEAATRALSAAVRDDPASAETSGAIERLVAMMAMRASIGRDEPPLALSDFDHVLESTGVEDLKEIWGG